MISLAMIAVQALVTVAIILGMRRLGWPQSYQAAAAAMGLMVALGLASVAKALLLRRLLGAPVQGWRWPLVWAAGGAAVIGWSFTLLPPSLEWIELAIGVPVILATFGAIVWRRGFTHEDRVLFRMGKGEKATLPPPRGASPPDR
jgi:hypothetical protein